MIRPMTNIHWLRLAIHICGGRPALAKLCQVGESCLTKWLNEEREINLENAIKIEKATGGRVTRDQLVSNRDKAYIADLKAEVEILKRSQPPLTFKQRVELGLAYEATLGCRQGARTDLLLGENFPEVSVNSDKVLNKKPVVQGLTAESAAELADLGSYKTYHLAKKAVKNGISELIEAVEKGLPISRAAKISEFSPEKQHYFLSLDQKLMIKALSEAADEKKVDKWKEINNSNFHSDKKNRSGDELTATWALLSFNVTLFKNKKTQKMGDEPTQNREEEISLQKTVTSGG